MVKPATLSALCRGRSLGVACPSLILGLRRLAGSSAAAHEDTCAVSDELRRELSELVGGRCSTGRALREQHGKDESYHATMAPDVVLFPESTAEVAAVHAACHHARAPVIPYGVGTSLEGHIAALRGGVCLDMSRMNAVLAVNAADMDCRVQAGVTRTQLNARLRDEGLWFSVDPGADATLGGMAATRASGTNTVRYGTMRENVLAAQAVLADGTVMETGRRVRKSAAGYDLTHLLVGSEGTLATMTELSVRVWPQPEAVAAAVCTFDSLQALVAAATAVTQLAVPVARMEMLDEVTVRAVNVYCGAALAEAPTLLFEFHGSDAGVAEASGAAAAVVAGEGGSGFQWATTQEDRVRLWEARHKAYWASKAARPGCHGFATDVCVPVSALAACVLASKALVDRERILSPMVGHVGDGNFHMMLMVDPADADEMTRARRVVDEMVALAHAAGGTCTGEHGVGHGKLKHLWREHGDAPLAAMHAIKRALDPRGIMNPGKLGSDPERMAR